MKATNNTTQRSAYGFIATLFFLSLFGTLEAQGVQQRSSLTHTRGDVDQALTRSDQAKTKGLQPLTPLFADPAQTNQGGRNASGGRDNGGEEPVVVVVDGYQSVDEVRVTGSRGELVETGRTNQGGRNASGGRDNGGEEPVVVVVDGYQSVDQGEVRVTLGGRLLDPAQTNQGGRNASGGRDNGGEEPVVVVVDGYQSVDQGEAQSSEATIEEKEAEALPSQATLHGNYPNPFNPTTTIRFELTDAQPVRLAVYNALGQLVEVLMDSQLGAGQHEVRFDAMNLASGLYLARLETPGGVSVQRMMLAK